MDAKPKKHNSDNAIDVVRSIARDAFEQIVDTESSGPELAGDVWESVSDLELVIEDPIFVEPIPGGPADPSDYTLLHLYWPRLVELVAGYADSFSIHCWFWDDMGLKGAQSVGGSIARRVGDTVVVDGAIDSNWASRVQSVCWGSGGELLWMNVVLYQAGKLALFSSHHGGELSLWLPPDGEVTEDDVRRSLPESVDVVPGASS